MAPARLLQNPLLQLQTCGPSLSKASRENHRCLDPSVYAVGDQGWHSRSRSGNYRQINRLGQGLQTGIGFQSQHAAASHIHREDSAPKRVTDEIPEDGPPNTAGSFGGPNNGNTARLKEGVQRMCVGQVKEACRLSGSRKGFSLRLSRGWLHGSAPFLRG
jgi:hypothetical protein